jgi:phosphatidylglycerol---prolipoprotein diacylglyceryl transferase
LRGPECAGRRRRRSRAYHCGQWKRRYPTQLFEAGFSATILIVGLSLHGPSDRPGLLFLGSAAAYGIGRLGLEPLRAEAVGTPLAVRINMAFSAMLAVVAIACFVALAARGV